MNLRALAAMLGLHVVPVADHEVSFKVTGGGSGGPGGPAEDGVELQQVD